MGHRADRFAGGGIQDREGAAGDAVGPNSVDKELSVR